MTNEPSSEGIGAYQRYIEMARSKINRAKTETDYKTILESCESAREYIEHAYKIISNDKNIEQRFTDAENEELEELTKKGTLLYANELWKEIAQTPRPKHWPGTYRNISIGICLQVLKDAGKKTEKEILEALKIKPKEYKRIIKLSRKEARQKKLA